MPTNPDIVPRESTEVATREARRIADQAVHLIDRIPDIRQGSQYTKADRLNAVSHHVLSGNIAATARATGIPHRTILDWSNSEWWGEVSTSIREEHSSTIKALFRQLVEKGAQSALDRIDEASPLQSMTIAAIAYDKLRVADGLPTNLTAKVDLTDRLSALGGQYRQDVIEGEIVGNGDSADSIPSIENQ